MMALDPDLLDAAAARIRADRADGIAAIGAAAAGVADQIRALDDKLLAGRASDVLDVGDRIARELAGLASTDLRLVEPSIVVAEDLPPSLTATLPRDRLLGIALEASSPTAHAAILARAYGIPAVVGATGLLAMLDAAGSGSPLALDGESGEILVAPTKEDVARYEARAGAIRRDRGRDVEEAGLPAVTKDGTKVELVANIGSPGEAAGAVALGARGVGLFRTEFLFLERSCPPSEDDEAKAFGDGCPIGEIDLGVMLEIPSAILTADTYVRELKFVSIGTNDLLQYTLAADRGNPALERYRDSLHPALLQLVRLAVEAAERARI